MAKDRIEYLIKFVKEKGHVQYLQDGKLFMRPTHAFIKMYYDEYYKKYGKFEENTFAVYMQTYAGCIGDVRESLLYEYSMTRANTNIPIFCMTYVASSQVVDKNSFSKIILNKKVIDEFKESGYKFAVVININEFVENINRHMIEGKSDVFAGFGPVIYKKRNTHEVVKDCVLNCLSGKNLFYKHPAFSYQQEYRIILNRATARYNACICTNSYKLYEYSLEDQKMENGKELKDYPSYTEEIDSIMTYSEVYSINDFKFENEKYSLLLNKEHK